MKFNNANLKGAHVFRRIRQMKLCKSRSDGML